jgi:SAM-dependent methyltransferase
MKDAIQKSYLLLRTIPRARELFYSFEAMFNEEILSRDEHIKLAGEWLLMMQNSDGGYSRKYSLAYGRDRSYIETTGYIIPTMLNLRDYLKDERYFESALKAGEWLLTVQNSDGSFNDIDLGRPLAFDSGQVLIGLNSLYQETKDSRFFDSARRVSYWLAENQESNGSWVEVAYNKQPHTYYTRVASAMLEWAYISNDDFIASRALKMVEWTISNQLESGFFRYSSFIDTKEAYLHTIVYILEGLLDVYQKTKSPKIFDSIMRSANRLKDVNIRKSPLLCSQYDGNFNCKNRERCVTGLAQWAGVAWRIYEITENVEFKEIALSTLFYLKAKQLKRGKNIRGALPSSVPFWGKYGTFSFVNWNNKFFIDALLRVDKYPLEFEQECWVKISFSSSSGTVSDTLSGVDKIYLKHFQSIFGDKKELRVLDLGCGKGKFIKELQRLNPTWEIVGVDPTFVDKSGILKGGVYQIPFEDNSFDIVLTIEVLQHTYIKKALSEIYRVLKNRAFLIVGERNPLSLLGVVKPIFELSGKWMYPYDTPFRERWYSKREWQELLRDGNFEIKDIFSINNPNDKKIKLLNRYFLIVGQKSGE